MLLCSLSRSGRCRTGVLVRVGPDKSCSCIIVDISDVILRSLSWSFLFWVVLSKIMVWKISVYIEGVIINILSHTFPIVIEEIF